MTKTRAERKLLNQIKKHESFDSAKRATERLGWRDTYKMPKDKSRYKTVMIAADFHDIEVDEFALRMWLNKLKKVKPDIIVINGDLFDLMEFSNYNKDPREYNLRARMNKVHDILDKMRKASPHSQINLIEGNHESRICRHLYELTPVTADLLNIGLGTSIREILGLDKFKINYIAKADLHSFTDAQLKKSVKESELVLFDTLWIKHEPPKVRNICMPGCNSHHHKYEVKHYFNPAYGSFQWIQTGAMCKKQASFTDGRIWSTGFLLAIVDVKNKKVVFDYTDVGDHGCLIGGKFFERKPEEYY